jgi:hypothetical protein
VPAVTVLATKLGSFLHTAAAFARAHEPFIKFAVLTAAGTAGILALGGAIALAAAAMTALGITSGVAMLLVFPIAGAIAAVAAGAFLIYENWGAVVAYFKAINWKNVGMDILKGLASGILAGLTYLAGPLGTVAKYILDYFHGHSPPPLGPLHDLNRIRIVETIAETIKPAAMMTAIRRTASGRAHRRRLGGCQWLYRRIRKTMH